MAASRRVVKKSRLMRRYLEAKILPHSMIRCYLPRSWNLLNLRCQALQNIRLSGRSASRPPPLKHPQERQLRFLLGEIACGRPGDGSHLDRRGETRPFFPHLQMPPK